MADKLSLLMILLWMFLCAELASGQGSVQAFQSGEYARYGAYFNWNFIWIQSGEAEFAADTVSFRNQKAWNLRSYGKTYKAYDLVYKVRDSLQTFCTYDSFRPIYSYRALNHANERSVHQYRFDPSSGTIASSIKLDKKPLVQGNFPIQENTFDLLGTAYNLRNTDFSKLFVGQKVPYRMIIDQKIDELFFRYLGTDIVKTRNGKKYRCHKVSVYLQKGDFFAEGEYMKIWFTDDKNHLPVQVETEIIIGSVKALLLETKNMKYPLTSLIQ